MKLTYSNPHFRFYKSFAIFAKKKNRVQTEFLQKCKNLKYFCYDRKKVLFSQK